MVKKEKQNVGEIMVVCSFKNIGDCIYWVFVGAYRLDFATSRRGVCELARLCSWWD